jgi:hypothetical protein
MPYQVDGNKVTYEEMLDVVLETIYKKFPVFYDYHMGIDLYWVESNHPDWAHEVELSDKGLIANNRLIERLDQESKEDD